MKPDSKTLARAAAIVLYEFSCEDNNAKFYTATEIYQRLYSKLEKRTRSTADSLSLIYVEENNIKWALYEQWVRDGKNYYIIIKVKRYTYQNYKYTFIDEQMKTVSLQKISNTLKPRTLLSTISHPYLDPSPTVPLLICLVTTTCGVNHRSIPKGFRFCVFGRTAPAFDRIRTDLLHSWPTLCPVDIISYHRTKQY